MTISPVFQFLLPLLFVMNVPLLPQQQSIEECNNQPSHPPSHSVRCRNSNQSYHVGLGISWRFLLQCCLKRTSNNNNEQNSHCSDYVDGEVPHPDDFLFRWFETKSLDESASKFANLVKDIFENHSKNLLLSEELIQAMLLEDTSSDDQKLLNLEISEFREEDTTCTDTNLLINDDNALSSHEENNIIFLHHHLELYQNEKFVLKGLPSRPFYKCFANRMLSVLYQRLKCASGDENCVITRPILDATDLNLSELESNLRVIDKIPVDSMSIGNVINYINEIGITGILEYLGLRTTVGTVISSSNDAAGYCNYLQSIPDIGRLIQAANHPCKPNANPPRLTLAGRARAKHAHRGSTDLFFGVCKGSTTEKNDAAINIVIDMIQRAVWINRHVFGGAKHPVLELRTKEGYGARWSMQDFNDDDETTTLFTAKEFTFRGFLEPQMNGGFEKKWRH